jgi:nitrite reductase/ring-hydroxylating ferredoxin subunit
MSNLDVAAAADVQERKALAVKAGGVSLLLTRIDGKIHAIENRCPHLGLPLARGRIEGTAITCPFHGSRFDVCSGRNLDWVNSLLGLPLPSFSHKLIALGKSPSDVRSFTAQEVGGRVYVKLS